MFKGCCQMAFAKIAHCTRVLRRSRKSVFMILVPHYSTWMISEFASLAHRIKYLLEMATAVKQLSVRQPRWCGQMATARDAEITQRNQMMARSASTTVISEGMKLLPKLVTVSHVSLTKSLMVSNAYRLSAEKDSSWTSKTNALLALLSPDFREAAVKLIYAILTALYRMMAHVNNVLKVQFPTMTEHLAKRFNANQGRWNKETSAQDAHYTHH